MQATQVLDLNNGEKPSQQEIKGIYFKMYYLTNQWKKSMFYCYRVLHLLFVLFHLFYDNEKAIFDVLIWSH